MKKEKGDYGYRTSYRRMRFCIAAVLAAAILAQLGARFLTDNEAAKNILTVMAILTVLPMANVASPLLAAWRYKTPPVEFYERVKPYEERARILYDLILTTKDDIVPADAAAVHPNGVFVYCPVSLKGNRAEKAVNELFAKNRAGLTVKLISDEKSFFRRLDSLKPLDSYVDDGTVEYGADLLKTLSM